MSLIVNLVPLLVAAGLPEPETEVSYGIPGRKFRADWAWPRWRVSLEREGNVFGNARLGSGRSRHTTGAGYERDCEKYNLVLLAGWLVLRVTPGQLQRGLYLAWVEQALRLRGWQP